MEERGKIKKRPDLQYYKPPKMVNKATDREGEKCHENSAQRKISHNHHSQYQHHHSQQNPEPTKSGSIVLDNIGFTRKYQDKEQKQRMGSNSKTSIQRDNKLRTRYHESKKVERRSHEGLSLTRTVQNHTPSGISNLEPKGMPDSDPKITQISESSEVQSSVPLHTNSHRHIHQQNSSSPPYQAYFQGDNQIRSSNKSSVLVSSQPVHSRISSNHESIRKDSREHQNANRELQSQDSKSSWRNSESSQKSTSSGSHPFDRKQRKFSSRNDHQQNLPPRFQKLMMEKANQGRSSHHYVNENVNCNSNATHDYQHQSNDKFKRGRYVLSIDSISKSNPQTYSIDSTGHHLTVHTNRVDSQLDYSRNDPLHSRFHGSSGDPKQQNWTNSLNTLQSAGIVHRHLYDPASTTKPCVVIRPTAHNTYQTSNNQSQNRCILPTSMLPMQLAAQTAGTHHQLATECINNLANTMKQWTGFGQSLDNDKRLPISPSNMLVHYLPNYPSPPHRLNHSNDPSHVSFNSGQFYDLASQSNRKLIEKNMTDILQLEQELQKALRKYPEYDERIIDPLRMKIQLRYQAIIVHDPKYCAEHNIEVSLWNTVFYQLIDLRRKELEESPESQESKDKLLKLVEEASLFFENLLDVLQDNFKFSIERFIEHYYQPDKPDYEIIKYAALSAQKIYLYLGDLARYREQASGSSNYSKAKSFYTKAQQIAPKNGLPYHQLALLAMYGRRRLDAVYNYMRSLATSIPFNSAKESLLKIFEEVREKYEAAEGIKISEKLEPLNLKDSSVTDLSDNNDTKKQEEWIHSDKSSCNHNSALHPELIKELEILSDTDLTKRFILSFLHVHGKLFTKDGLESFNTTVNQMFLEFRCLLKRSPFPMSSQRLLQLMAINMFSVYHASLIDGAYDTSRRSFLQEKAIHVTLAMVSLLLERVCNSFDENTSKAYSIVRDDVAELLPALKIWTDWMSCQKHIWFPPLSDSEFVTGIEGDVWSLLADVLTRLGEINIRSVMLLPTRFEGCDQVILPEDSLLFGFIPLYGAPCAPSYIQPPYDKENARTCLRISRIQFFGDYLCGIPEPYLEFDVGNKRFNSRVAFATQNVLENKKTQNSNDNESEDFRSDSACISLKH